MKNAMQINLLRPVISPHDKLFNSLRKVIDCLIDLIPVVVFCNTWKFVVINNTYTKVPKAHIRIDQITIRITSFKLTKKSR